MGCKIPDQFFRQGAIALLILLSALVCPVLADNQNFTPVFNSSTDVVHVNTSTIIHDNATTPIEIWLIAALLGIGLFYISLQARQSVAEVEKDILISIMAWIPIGYTAATSWAVERIAGYGVASSGSTYVLLEQHIIYHFDVIGVIYSVLFLVAIANTVRIYALHKSLRLQRETEKGGLNG